MRLPYTETQTNRAQNGRATLVACARCVKKADEVAKDGAEVDGVAMAAEML